VRRGEGPDGNGQLALPFDLFESASKGAIEAFMGSPQYWQDREPAFEWFGTIRSA